MPGTDSMEAVYDDDVMAHRVRDRPEVQKLMSRVLEADYERVLAGFAYEHGFQAPTLSLLRVAKNPSNSRVDFPTSLISFSTEGA